MSTITTRAGKGSPLTYDEMDANFTNLNNDKLEAAALTPYATITMVNGKEPTITGGTTSQYWRGDKTWQTLDKTAVGLSNVDNTSDANKPVSTAQQTALDLKAPLTSPNFTGTPSVGSVELGYKDVPSNVQTVNYTLELGDRGKSIDFTGAAGQIITIPANSSVPFPVGSVIVITNNSANTLSVAITSDTLRQAGTSNTGTRLIPMYGIATIRKVASTTWIISGNIA